LDDKLFLLFELSLFWMDCSFFSIHLMSLSNFEWKYWL